MSYPLSETFATAPVTGYTAVLGGMDAAHNTALQSIDISAPSGQSILRFNETAHGDFWFEADVELLTDPSARKHIGLWMTTGNGSEGYRFAHLDDAWVVTRWNSGFGDGVAVTGGVNDGAKPVAGVADKQRGGGAVGIGDDIASAQIDQDFSGLHGGLQVSESGRGR